MKKLRSILSLAWLASRNNWDAHVSSPWNLAAAALGMVINNSLVLAGLWMMLFAGKSRNQDVLPYFVSLNALVPAAWGMTNLFAGGLRNLGELIEEGELESMLSTPRHPLWLVAFSRSHAVALGDLVQGFLTMASIPFLPGLAPGAGWPMFFRCLCFTFVAAGSFAGLFILAGSVAFYLERGANAAWLLIEATLGLSAYPTGKIFSGPGRFLLYVSPAAATAVLPVDAIETAKPGAILAALLASFVLLSISVAVFNRGVRRFRSVSLIGART